MGILRHLKGLALAALALGFCLGSTAVHAQKWGISNADPAGRPIAVVPGNGNVKALALLCNKAEPVLLVGFTQQASRSPVSVELRVAGKNFVLQAYLYAKPAEFAAKVGDAALIDSLASGEILEIVVEERSLGGVSLQNSRTALEQALAACWQPPTSPTVFEDEATAPPVVEPRLKAEIMRAAGFVQKGNTWTTCDGEEVGEIEQLRDLNGDGKREAVVIGTGTACRGMTGVGFFLLTEDIGRWRLLFENTGIPQMFARPGLTWPDIEIGGRGFDCFPFLRWDGSAYVKGGTSQAGKICTLEPRFASEAKASVGSATGILGRVPIRLGYYVPERRTCAATDQLYKFERDRWWDLFSEAGEIGKFERKLARVSGPIDGFYILEPYSDGSPEGKRDAGPVIRIRPLQDGSIEFLEFEVLRLQFCPEKDVSARWRP